MRCSRCAMNSAHTRPTFPNATGDAASSGRTRPSDPRVPRFHPRRRRPRSMTVRLPIRPWNGPSNPYAVVLPGAPRWPVRATWDEHLRAAGAFRDRTKLPRMPTCPFSTATIARHAGLRRLRQQRWHCTSSSTSSTRPSAGWPACSRGQ